MAPGIICSVAVCKNTFYKQKQEGFKVAFFRFPKDVKIQKQWVKQCSRNDAINVKTARICSVHFKMEDFVNDIRAQIMKTEASLKLKPTAVPTLHLKYEIDVSESEKLSRSVEAITSQNTKVDLNEVMIENEITHFERICGICLTTSKDLTPGTNLLETNSCHTILDAMEKVMSINLSNYEHFPGKVCIKCLESLKISYNLKVLFEKSQKLLSKLYPHLLKSRFKSEVDIVVGEQSYSLNDLLIVENQPDDKNDYEGFLKNLGNSVKVTFVKQDSDTRNYTGSVKKSVKHLSRSVNIEPGKKYIRKRNKNYLNLINKQIEALIIDKENPDSIKPSQAHLVKKRIKVKRQENTRNIDFDALLEEENPEISKQKQMLKIVETSDDEENAISSGEVNYVTIYGNADQLEENILQEKLIFDALNSKHVCEICQAVFSMKCRLNKHLVLEHGSTQPDLVNRYKKKTIVDPQVGYTLGCDDGMEKYLCQECGHVALSSGGATYHQLTHKGKSVKCKLCPKVFYTPSHLKRHLNYNHLNKKTIEICPHCGKKCNSNSAYRYHLKLHNQSDRKYPCSLCNKSFPGSSALKHHLKRHKSKKYPCKLCDWAFYTSGELDKHFSVVHVGKKKFSCKYCDKKFGINYNLKMHLMTHEGPHGCLYCSRGFPEPAILEHHIYYKHEKTKTKIINDNSCDTNTEDMDSNMYISIEN